MPDNVAYTIQVPIRQVDAEDVKNAFAKMFSYPEKVDLGFGVLEPNPITKEVFVEKCCAQFLFNIYKNYMVQKAENDAKIAAENESNQRSQEVVQWFDNLRSEAFPENLLTNHPTVDNISSSINSNDNTTIVLTGTDPDNLPLTFEIVNLPSHGTAELTDNTIVYQPNIEFGGNDTIAFRASNGTKNSNVGEVSISVTCAKPYSSNVNVTTNVNTALDVTLSGNDYLGGTITYSLGSATSGSMSLDGNVVTYTPEQDYVGQASFGFTVNNGVIDSDEYYVYITIE
jgi:hypothetical protein